MTRYSSTNKNINGYERPTNCPYQLFDTFVCLQEKLNVMLKDYPVLAKTQPKLDIKQAGCGYKIQLTSKTMSIPATMDINYSKCDTRGINVSSEFDAIWCIANSWLTSPKPYYCVYKKYVDCNEAEKTQLEKTVARIKTYFSQCINFNEYKSFAVLGYIFYGTKGDYDELSSDTTWILGRMEKLSECFYQHANKPNARYMHFSSHFKIGNILTGCVNAPYYPVNILTNQRVQNFTKHFLSFIAEEGDSSTKTFEEYDYGTWHPFMLKEKDMYSLSGVALSKLASKKTIEILNGLTAKQIRNLVLPETSSITTATTVDSLCKIIKSACITSDKSEEELTLDLLTHQLANTRTIITSYEYIANYYAKQGITSDNAIESGYKGLIDSRRLVFSACKETQEWKNSKSSTVVSDTIIPALGEYIKEHPERYEVFYNILRMARGDSAYQFIKNAPPERRINVFAQLMERLGTSKGVNLVNDAISMNNNEHKVLSLTEWKTYLKNIELYKDMPFDWVYEMLKK